MARLEQLAGSLTLMTPFGSLAAVHSFYRGARFITAIYGKEFSAAALPLVIVSFGQFVNVAAGSVGLLLSMTGNQVPFKRDHEYLSAVGNVGLSFL